MWGLVLALATGCPGGGDDTGKVDDSGDDSGDDTGHDTGDGCGEDGLCDVIVSEVLGECGEELGAPTLSAIAEAPGAVRVKLADAEQGCCPTVTADVLVSQRTGEISFSYAFTADDCDCVCQVDVSFLVSDVPAGNWNVVWDVQSVGVTVE